VPRIGSDTTPINASRRVDAGTGLTGGGDLTADRVLEAAFGTTSTTVARGNDSRFGQWDLFTGTPSQAGQTPVWNTSTQLFEPGTPPAAMDAEQVRDLMGATLVGGDNITVNVNDAGDTVTISASVGATVSDASPTTKGVIQLAGDLGGTAAAPLVPNKVNTSLVLTAGTGLTGGGNLTANRSFAVAYGTTSGTALQGSTRGAANGVAPLDANSQVPAVNLPLQLKPLVVSGPMAGTITLDASQGSSQAVLINAATTFAPPTGAVDGMRMAVEVRNSVGFTCTINFTSFVNISGASLPVSLVGGAVLLAGFYWSARDANWFLVSANWES
jgi:hypothetical protein